MLATDDKKTARRRAGLSSPTFAQFDDDLHIPNASRGHAGVVEIRCRACLPWIFQVTQQTHAIAHLEQPHAVKKDWPNSAWRCVASTTQQRCSVHAGDDAARLCQA